MILESSVERPPECVPRGSWQGMTRSNSRSIATSYNAARGRVALKQPFAIGCAVRALVVVAGLTQQVNPQIMNVWFFTNHLPITRSGQLRILG